jgi:hypothetical protein
MCSPNHVIRQQRFGIDRQRDKGKESQKLAEKEGLSEAGHKGGETVSQDKEHMSEIGKKGEQK